MASSSVDMTAEITFIRVVCSPALSALTKSKILANVDTTYFGFSLTREIFVRIQAVMRQHSYIPSMLELVTDPGLSADAKTFIKDRSPKKLRITRTLLRSLRTTLLTYRQIRTMLSVAKYMVENVSKPDANVNRLIERSVNKLNSAREEGGKEEVLHHFGKLSNADKLIDAIVHGTGSNLIPTGFVDYDSKTGGVPEEGLFVLAATTSGGKSTLCNILLKNFYLNSNKNVVKVTLEMSDMQEVRRLASNLTQIEYSKYTRATLSSNEKRKTVSTFKDEFVQHGQDNDCTFTIWSPSSISNLDGILLTLKPYNYQVIAIDYISLLEDDSRRDQWKFLEEISKKCKDFTRKNKCLIILLAQLDEDSEKIRYSRAIKENADIAWVWSYYKKEQRESKIINIHNIKGRDSDVFSFDLYEKFHVMSVDTVSSSDSSNSYDKETKPQAKKTRDFSKNKNRKKQNTDILYADETIDMSTGEILKKNSTESKNAQCDELNLDSETVIDYAKTGMF